MSLPEFRQSDATASLRRGVLFVTKVLRDGTIWAVRLEVPQDAKWATGCFGTQQEVQEWLTTQGS